MIFKYIKKLIFISLLVIVLPLVSCAKNKNEEKKFDDVSEFNDDNIEIGINTGSSIALQIEKIFDKANIYFLSGTADLLNAINTEKVDVIAHEEINVRYLLNEHKHLEIVKDKNNILGDVEYGLCFNKNEKGTKLQKDFDEYLNSIKETGELDELINYWSPFDLSENAYVDYVSLPNINGKILMYVEAQFRPFAFVHYTRLVGLDIALMYEYCKDRGYALEVLNTTFESLIPAIISDRCDVIGGGITITDERKERVLFSDPVAKSKIVIIKNNKAAIVNNSLKERISNSIYKTFIKENRYKLFLNGILVTLIITISSFIVGSLVGFLLYLLYYSGVKTILNIFSILSWIFKRLPNVVFLMILFFIIFSKINLNGMTVAIIGFGTIFATTVFFILYNAIKSIDGGQIEAANALGYSKNKTLFKILIPQVIEKILNNYSSEIINLIKATSIVGYVMLTDLTKAGDIVRSRTYEAFFPLIAVATIYILLAEVLILIVKFISDIIIKKIK